MARVLKKKTTNFRYISFVYFWNYDIVWFVLQQRKTWLGLFYLVGLPGPGQNQGTVFGLVSEGQTQ